MPITVYKDALNSLNEHTNFDLGYFHTPREDFITGSMQALTTGFVTQFIKQISQWVKDSNNAIDLFNRYSIYVWYCICLLTGIRPNNGMPGSVKMLDEESGWLIVDDKPNRNSSTQRLIPLCLSVIKQVEDYKQFLRQFRQYLLANKDIASSIRNILMASNDQVILNLLNTKYQFAEIKREDIENLTPMDLDISPYWTRHFVRTQLDLFRN